MEINVNEAISKGIPYTDEPGMVILIVQREVYDYTPYYPDPRIKYITCVDSEFNNACRIKKSFAGFISKDWHRLDGNKYVTYLDVICLGKDAQECKSNITMVLDETKKYFEDVYISHRNVEKTEDIKYPWIAICGAECENISSSLPKLFVREEKLSGIVFTTKQNEMENGKIESAFQTSYSGCKIKFMMNVDFRADFERIRKEVMDLISKVDSTVNRPDKLKMVEQSLLKFIETHFPGSSSFSSPSMQKQSRTEAEVYQYLFNIEESIQFVVHHVEEMNSYAIKVCGKQNVGREVHIISKDDGIDSTLVINNQARKGIKKFLDENPSGEIDVILQIQDDSTRACLESYLTAQMERVNVNFLQGGNTPTHPWVFVCDTFDEDKFLKLKDDSKDYGSMLLNVHGCQTLPIEAKIRDIGKDDDKTIHLCLRISEIDDSLYMNDCAKHELRRIMESIGNVAAVPFQHPKPIHIKYLANLSKKAFSNFMEKYITRIEPIWSNEEDCKEGSLCIVVCFTLSRPQVDIAAVVRITQQDCKNMLVVIQNCREGISPGPMLKYNSSENFIDFTNILSEDGECYDCRTNSLAAEKIQAFIDNN
ncbi:uncharacterized protein LOC125675751 isoform X2 [Ostrea edulis]|nr:uncharacterized protein LOC125675751 isoform X2 [Ostrea edulis]